MTSALVLAIGALILGIGAIAQLLPQRDGADAPPELRALPRSPLAWSLLETLDESALSTRLTRAGVADRISAHALLAAKLGGACGRPSVGDGRGPRRAQPPRLDRGDRAARRGIPRT